MVQQCNYLDQVAISDIYHTGDLRFLVTYQTGTMASETYACSRLIFMVDFYLLSTVYISR